MRFRLQERLHDRIATPKRKDMWMGAPCPWATTATSDPRRRELMANAAEAEVVRSLFRLPDELGCLRRVEKAAAERGIRSRLRTVSDGRTAGGFTIS